MQRGAIILCGGRASRMGVDKALLPFGKGTMLGRIVDTVSSVIAPESVVIVAARNQSLPNMRVNITYDSTEYQGPLAAIARGLEALPSHVNAIFATGCDTPLLKPTVIELLFDRLASFDCVVPRDAERLYPLCGVYNTAVLDKLQSFPGRSLHAFLSMLDLYEIPTDELRAVDPGLVSLRNVNTHDDYVAALAVAGLSTP